MTDEPDLLRRRYITLLNFPSATEAAEAFGGSLASWLTLFCCVKCVNDRRTQNSVSTTLLHSLVEPRQCCKRGLGYNPLQRIRN